MFQEGNPDMTPSTGRPTVTHGTSDESIMVTPPLSNRATYAYALGELGVNMPWNMVTGFLLFYYTNVAMLPVAVVGTLLLVTRILDAAIDPVMGSVVDRTRTRFGRARPYMLFGALPFALLFAMTFSVPEFGTSGKIIYAAITFGLLGILFAILYIPCHAMLPLMTNHPRDKLRLGSFRAMAASIGSIMVYGLTMPMVSWFGHGDQQRGFTVAAAAVGLFMAGTLFVVVACCRERLGERRRVEINLKRDVAAMFRNPPWLVAAGFTMAMFLRFGVVVGSTAFYAYAILGKAGLASLMLSSLSVSILIGGFIARPILAWLGKRRANIIALTIAIALNILLYFLQGNMTLFSVVYFIANITLGIQSTTTFVLVADSVDYQETQTGVRNEGMLSSCVSFSTKVGLAIGGSIVAYALAIVGYDPNAVSEGAKAMIVALFFGGSIVFAALQMLVISFHKERAPQA